MAALAGLAFLASPVAGPAAHGQVFSSTPYVPAPDPAVEALRQRLDTLEADLKRTTSRYEQMSRDLGQARRLAEEANAGRIRAEKSAEELAARVQVLERLASGDESAAAEVQRNPANATVNLLAPSTDAQIAVAAAGPQPVDIDLSTLPQDEAGLLKEARNLLLEGRYGPAEQAFGVYLANHGKAASAHEAQYMLGEARLYQGAYADAADAYGKLLSAYPDSSFGPMGLVKLARSMRLMDKKAEACQALGLMGSRFPKAPAEARELAATEKQRASC